MVTRGSAGARAECFVVREVPHLVLRDLARIDRADRAVRIAADLELGEGGAECVVEEQAAVQGVARAGNELDYLDRLEQPHHARQHAEYAGGAAGWRQLGRRRRRVEA